MKKNEKDGTSTNFKKMKTFVSVDRKRSLTIASENDDPFMS